jgi:hypothetical protein
MSILSSLVQAIPAILTGFQGRDNKAQKRTANQATDLARASVNPNSAQYQSLFQTNRQGAQQDLASAVSEVSRQNRKLVGMGRTPLLDQERGGESIFRNLMLGQAQAGDQARRLTFDQLSGGASSLGRAAGLQGEAADQDYANKLRKVGSFYSIGDAMRGLGIGGPVEDMNDIVAAREANSGDAQRRALMQLFGLS